MNWLPSATTVKTIAWVFGALFLAKRFVPGARDVL